MTTVSTNTSLSWQTPCLLLRDKDYNSIWAEAWARKHFPQHPWGCSLEPWQAGLQCPGAQLLLGCAASTAALLAQGRAEPVPGQGGDSWGTWVTPGAGGWLPRQVSDPRDRCWLQGSATTQVGTEALRKLCLVAAIYSWKNRDAERVQGHAQPWRTCSCFMLSTISRSTSP